MKIEEYAKFDDEELANIFKNGVDIIANNKPRKEEAVAVLEFIKKEWGEGKWEMGFVQCMIGHAASLSKEVKQVVIEYGPEKAFRKISNQEDEITYNKVFQACEKNSETALKAANQAKEEAAEQGMTSESFSKSDLPRLLESLEKQLVKSAKYYKTMAFFLTDTSCIIKSKKRLKYNKEAAIKVRKAVTDFFITTLEIASPL